MKDLKYQVLLLWFLVIDAILIILCQTKLQKGKVYNCNKIDIPADFGIAPLTYIVNIWKAHKPQRVPVKDNHVLWKCEIFILYQKRVRASYLHHSWISLLKTPQISLLYCTGWLLSGQMKWMKENTAPLISGIVRKGVEIRREIGNTM